MYVIHNNKTPKEMVISKSQPIRYIAHPSRTSHMRASLIAQWVKNLPAMQETPVRFLGWEDLLEKG